MDFSPNEMQQEIEALSDRLMRDVSATSEGGAWLDETLWRQLAEADLIGLALPTEHGGSGLSFLELCTLLCGAGARAARVPLAGQAIAGMAIARFGADHHKAALLPGLADGSRFIAPALHEPLSPTPTLSAARIGDRWHLNGAKQCVPHGMAAHMILASATIGDGQTALFLCETSLAGVTRTQHTALSGEPQANIAFDDVTVEATALLEGDSAVAWLARRMNIANCALQFGAARAAIALAVDWVREREQFGRPLMTFQAVSLRTADALIALEGARLTLWRAAYQLAHEEDSDDAIAVAKYWAAEAGSLAVTTSHRLHGGVGVDMSYKLARLTVLNRQLEFTGGGARETLARLGHSIAQRALSAAALET